MGSGGYLGEFEQVVLLALARLPGEAYGGSVHDEILAATGRDVSIPAVYVTLKRLEKKGLVRSSIGGGEGRTRRRTRNYVLTSEGRDALARSRALLERLWDGADVPAPGEGGR